MNKINKKQTAFLDAYFALNLNACQAYKNVYGITDDNVAAAAASRLLTNVKIQAEITNRQAVIASKFEITRDNMITNIIKLMDSCITEGQDGCGIIKDRTNWAKALDMLNKMGGLYQSKLDITSTGEQVKINLNLAPAADPDVENYINNTNE